MYREEGKGSFQRALLVGVCGLVAWVFLPVPSFGVQVRYIPLKSQERGARYSRFITRYTGVFMTLFRDDFFFQDSFCFFRYCTIFYGKDFPHRRSVIRLTVKSVDTNEPTRQFATRDNDGRLSKGVEQTLREEATTRDGSVNTAFHRLHLSFDPPIFDRNVHTSRTDRQFTFRFHDEDMGDRLFTVTTMYATILCGVRECTRVFDRFTARTNEIRDDRDHRLQEFRA